MEQKSGKLNETDSRVAEGSTQPTRSLTFADRELKSGHDVIKAMSAVFGDVIAGRLAPPVANAAVNAVGKLLKTVELQLHYGGGLEKPMKLLG